MLNINKLKEMYKNNVDAKAVLDVLAKTKEDTPASSVDALVKYSKIERKKVVNVFQTFQELGLGTFVAGRSRKAGPDSRGVYNRGYRTDSRFNWRFRKSQVANAARGVSVEVEPMLNDSEPLPQDLGYLPEVESKPVTLPEIRKTESIKESIRLVDVSSLMTPQSNVIKIVDFDNTVTHHIRLRKDLEISVSVPENITKAEITKIISYLTYCVDTID